MEKRVLLTLVNIAVYVGSLVLVGLCAAGKMGSQKMSRWSNQLTPPSWMFAVAWDSIYFMEFVVLIMTLFVDIPTCSILGFTILASITNGLWIPIWSYGYIKLALLDLVVLWGTVHGIDMLLTSGEMNKMARYMWRFTFGMYQGWMSLAVILNLSAVLQAGVTKAPEGRTWAIVWIIVIGVVGTVYYSILMRNGGSTIIIVLAYISLASKHYNTKSIKITSLVFAIIVLVSWILAVLISRNKSNTVKTPLLEYN